MTDAEPRSTEQRKADTLAKLAAPVADVWVATAAAQAGGHASSHLVPLSLAWVDERVVLATEADSVTARNIASERHARLGLGPTRDVVMIDAELEQVYRLDEVPARPGPAIRGPGGLGSPQVGRADAVPGAAAAADPGVAGGQRTPRPDPDARRHLDDLIRSRGHGGGSGTGRSVRMYVRAPASPRRSLFELAGDPDEHVLPAVGGDQLHADRQASGGPVQRQADGRLAGHVELRGVRDEADDPPAFVLGPGGGEPPELRWRCAEGGCQEQVVFGPPVRHLADPYSHPGPALQVRHRAEGLACPPVGGVARLDLVAGDRASEQRLELLERRFGIGCDDRVEVPGELLVEHAGRRGLRHMVTE